MYAWVGMRSLIFILTEVCLLPELRLPPCDTIDKHVLRVPQCQGNRASSLIASIAVLVIPLDGIWLAYCFNADVQKIPTFCPFPKNSAFPCPRIEKSLPPIRHAVDRWAYVTPMELLSQYWMSSFHVSFP